MDGENMIREKRSTIQNLVTAIATKPFILLAGISGSGKTQIARRIAAGLAAGVLENGQYLGRPFGGEASSLAYQHTLVKNGVVPSILGSDGDEIIDIAPLVVDAQAYKGSGLDIVNRDRVAFLPVRPDWAEPQKVWGFYNPLTGLYYPTPAMRVVMHAFLEYVAYGEAAPRHFLILDELNLSRVEYYLSDLLSLMETPTTLIKRGGDVQIKIGELAMVHPFNKPLWSLSAPQFEIGAEKSSHEQLFVGKMDHGWSLAYHYLTQGSAGMMLKHMAIDMQEVIHGADWHRVVPPNVTFTPNLTIIGTVNVDETTFAFSPKVLDRAFVLAFNDMHFEDVCGDWAGFAEAKADILVLESILKSENMHFGYRVVAEVLSFMQQAGGGWRRHGDFLLCSKVLTKLRGGEDKLGPILPLLLAYALTGETEIDALYGVADRVMVALVDGAPFAMCVQEAGLQQVVYPKSAQKIYHMTRQLVENGLATYF